MQKNSGGETSGLDVEKDGKKFPASGWHAARSKQFKPAMEELERIRVETEKLIARDLLVNPNEVKDYSRATPHGIFRSYGIQKLKDGRFQVWVTTTDGKSILKQEAHGQIEEHIEFAEEIFLKAIFELEGWRI